MVRGSRKWNLGSNSNSLRKRNSEFLKLISIRKSKIKASGVLGVRKSAELYFGGGGAFAPRRNKPVTFCKDAYSVPGLYPKQIKQNHLLPEISLKKERAGFRGSKRPSQETYSHRCDLWRLCAPLVCLANTFSSFKTAPVTPLGGPLVPFGTCLLCPLCFQALCAKTLSNITNRILSGYLFTYLNSIQ